MPCSVVFFTSRMLAGTCKVDECRGGWVGGGGGGVVITAGGQAGAGTKATAVRKMCGHHTGARSCGSCRRLTAAVAEAAAAAHHHPVEPPHIWNMVARLDCLVERPHCRPPVTSPAGWSRWQIR